jgi:hypothetical protein
MYKQDWKLELQNFELKNKPQDIVTEVKSILYKWTNLNSVNKLKIA